MDKNNQRDTKWYLKKLKKFKKDSLGTSNLSILNFCIRWNILEDELNTALEQDSKLRREYLLFRQLEKKNLLEGLDDPDTQKASEFKLKYHFNYADKELPKNKDEVQTQVSIEIIENENSKKDN